ncbi:MAG: SUMF1/EgtB/PvdO family nonheme iron enzyme [Anaerolineae bacterium]|nr:SUMF1/EgtB/PvdO family nonheme iron enzyme [Anaerolineae bacterium]
MTAAIPGARQPFEPELVPIPAGPFRMGTSARQIEWLVSFDAEARRWQEAGRFSREQPAHGVALDAYQIGRYPVTVGQFRVFVTAGGYATRRYWTDAGWAWRAANGIVQPAGWDDPRWTANPEFPVTGVSWCAALAYCRWLCEVTGRAYRLPTEAEWEKAARGSDERLYPWGNAFDPALGNTRASGTGHLLPVTTSNPSGDSPYGCAGMGGNVSDWTLSRFAPYPYADDGRNDPAGATLRVIRGGSWQKPPLRARTATRGMNDPFFQDHDVGVRCACTE